MAFSGRIMLIKTGGGSEITIAGLRDSTLTVNETEVDVTSKDDAGVRQLLAGNILRSVSVSGTGVFKNEAVMHTLRDDALAGTHQDLTIVIPGDDVAGGEYTGSFRITSFEESGVHDGEQQYSITFASAGAVTFTPAPEPD